MKIILLLLLVSLSAFWKPSAVIPQRSGLKNIQTDRYEIYPTAVCWWCSCWVAEPGRNSQEKIDYLRVVAASLQ